MSTPYYNPNTSVVGGVVDGQSPGYAAVGFLVCIGLTTASFLVSGCSEAERDEGGARLQEVASSEPLPESSAGTAPLSAVASTAPEDPRSVETGGTVRTPTEGHVQALAVGDTPQDSASSLEEVRGALRREDPGTSGTPASTWARECKLIEDLVSRLKKQDAVALRIEVRDLGEMPGTKYSVARRSIIVLKVLRDYDTLCTWSMGRAGGLSEERLQVQAAAAAMDGPVDVERCGKLLDSRNDEVVVLALSKIAGTATDDGVRARVQGLLESSNPMIRCAAIATVAQEPSPQTADERAKMIVKAIGGLRELSGDRDHVLASGQTRLEVNLSVVYRALIKFGGPVDALATMSGVLKEPEAVFVAAALAERGIAGSRTALVGALGRALTPGTRVVAVRGLGHVGREEDLPLLDRLAAEDPFSTRPDDAVGGEPEVSYPVRDYAAEAAREIRRRVGR